MTAEVAILNVYGVAMAADSAVTLGLGKVYNSADKLFALSKHHPVGIMIYNNVDIMGIGWETIIKNYRNDLRDKSFDTLSGYAESFINYLSQFPYFCEKQMKKYFYDVCTDIFKLILKYFIINLDNFYGDKENITRKQIDDVFVKTLKEIKEDLKDVSEEKQLKIDEDYIDSQMEVINERLKKIFGNYPIPKKNKQEIICLIKLLFQKCSCWLKNFTGIVICGYGERELFPVIYTYKVSGKLGKSLIYFSKDDDHIDPSNLTSSIRTFAQTEVVDTFIDGIAPDLAKGIEDNLIFTLASMQEHLPEKYKSKIPQIIELFQEYLKETTELIYRNPVLEIVDTLEKEDLTSMAEAMINITALKRRISTDSETVGGPIDVAYISKGDGFIWIKKKTNYDPTINFELNQSYFRGRQL